jgi:chromosome partitioning protein
MFDARTNLSHQVVESITADHKLELLEPPIPKSVRVAEAPGFGKSVLTYAPRSKPAVAYRELVQTIRGRL